MLSSLYRSAAVAVLVAAGSMAGPAMISHGFAQEAQSEAPPIPMDKVNKKRCKGNADCAADSVEDVVEKAVEESENAAAEGQKEAERAAKKAEEEARREAEKAERAVEKEAEKAKREAEDAGEEVEQAVEGGKKRKPAEEVQEQVQEPAAAETPEPPAETAEQPAETPVEQATEQPVEQPAAEQPAAEQAAEQPDQQKSEQPVEQQAAEPKQPEAGQGEQATERKDRRKRREAKGARTAEPELTVEEAREELEKPATVSPEAEKPKEVASEPIQEQLQKAEEEQTAVIPDQLTKKERDDFVRAEKKRRERARDDRGTLLGAAAVGAVIGAIIPQLGGRVEADQGDRLVVYRDGDYYVRKDESALLRGDNVRVEYERLDNGRTREIITRRDGTQIITVKDAGGYMLRRVKVLPNGTRIVLFDFRDDRADPWQLRDIPRYRVEIPRDRYIVSARQADRRLFRDTFRAPPVYVPEQRYTLAQIREYEPVRAMVRRVDLDTINFAFGSAFVEASQVALLGDIAGGMLDVIYEDPESIFLIEGHTDAVGSEIDNLLLSDRRAEAVARILVEAYDVPPENLVTQGYGESYLKVETEGPEQANRRATVRNITPILDARAE
jgi:outer membrane protein OmpA-like peptidoglycan-associated protein